MRVEIRSLLIAALTLCITMSTAMAAQAEVTIDIANGYLAIKNNAYSVNGGGDTPNPSNSYNIVQTDPGIPTTNGITAQDGVAVSITVTLDSVNMAGINLGSTGDLSLVLAEGTTNRVQGNVNQAGIRVVVGAKLTISGTGTLDVYGGEWAAGIGGNKQEHAGTVEINSGIVSAYGRWNSAGIGGGAGRGISDYEPGYNGGNITINGGTVYAAGDTGIGGSGSYRGTPGAGGNVTITGGSVIATGANGIGAGVQTRDDWSGTPAVVKIDNGAAVRASAHGTMYYSGAAIDDTAIESSDGIKSAATLFQGTFPDTPNSFSDFTVVISNGGNPAASITVPNGHKSFAATVSSGGTYTAGIPGMHKVIARSDNSTDFSITANQLNSFAGLLLISAFSVTYDGNGNTGGSSPIDGNLYAEGATVTVLGNTGDLVRSGYTFIGWNTQADGNGTDRAPGAAFSIGTANLTLYAHWMQNPTLTIVKAGTGGGTVISSPAGVECGLDCWESYLPDTLITLNATPDADSVFSGWSGACSGTGLCEVTMDSAKSVTATFDLVDNRPFSNCTVLPNPSACNQSVSFDGTLSYHGHPLRNIVSYEWDFGDGQSGSGPTTSHAYAAFGSYTAQLTVTDDNVPPKTATATATVNVALGNLAPVANASGPYTVVAGNGVTLNASASFDANASCGDTIVSYDWDLNNDGQFGDVSGVSVSLSWAQLANWGLQSAGSHTIRLRVMDMFGASQTAQTTITVIQQYQLTVSKAGTGGGMVTSNPAGISCGEDCSEVYTSGTAVSLTATPDKDSSFSGWSGDFDCQDGSVTMDAPKNCIATFSLDVCTSPPSGLIAWWGGDNNALDMAGGNNGMLMNGATYAEGRVGQAFSFDGVDDYISGNGSQLPLGNTARTILAWIKTDRTSDQNIFHYGIQNGTWPPKNFHLLLANVGVTAVAGIGNGWGYGGAFGSSNISDNQWHLIAGVYEGAGTNLARLFVDGVEENNGVITEPGTGAGSFEIGRFLSDIAGPGAEKFKGLIDEIAIFNRALTTQEIAAIYSAGSAGICRTCAAPPADIISEWKAEDNADDSIGLNNGTAQNGMLYAEGKVGQAFSFDGVDDYVGIPNVVDSWPTGTVALWAIFKNATPKDSGDYIYTATVGAPGSNGGDGTNLGIHKAAGNDLRFGIWASGWNWAASGVVPNAGQWYHIVATWGSAGMKIYVDGTLKGTHSYAGASTNSNYNTIGASSYLGSTVNAFVDEVTVMNRALTAQEVAALYNSGSAGICAPDTTVDQFTFTDLTDVPVNTARESDTITISGINKSVLISITDCSGSNCQYRVNGGAWTSIDGTVNNGDTVQVRQTSSSSYGVTTDLILNIGAVADVFSISTPPQRLLSVSHAGTGTGTSYSQPMGILCGENCSALFDPGLVVTLSAEADNGSVFSGWSGDEDCGDGIVTMNTNVSCTVTFTAVPKHLLTVSKTGSGMVTSSPAGISCGSTCSSLFNEGQVVTMTATPSGGSIFTGWSGACTGAGACQVTMSAAKSVTAHFAADVSLTWTNIGGTLETCVGNATDLQNALHDAETDGMPNRIKVVQGTYIGLFAYLGENQDLTLEGGYSSGCTGRTINPTLTVLDGDLDTDNFGDGVVLDLMVGTAGAGNITVNGFHVKKGSNGFDHGGGIRAFTSGGNLTLSHNKVSENTAPSGGGIAAYSGSGDIVLHHNTVRGNTADYGAGILAGSETGDTILINNLITDNLAALDGGGLATATTTGAILLLNNTIANNDALSDDGGGVALLLNSDIASADLTNNLIWGNTTGTGTCGDIYIDSDYDLNGTHAAVVLMNNDFNQATGICTTGNPPSIDPSNLSVDPLFVDPANGDYHLALGSPVIDKGTSHGNLPSEDIDGQERVSGAAVDMGADEIIQPGAMFWLTLSKAGTGNGTVTSIPAGIDCGDVCSNLFVQDQAVTLLAAADPGSVFAGWSGDPDCTDGMVTMDAAKTCTATFMDATVTSIRLVSPEGGEIVPAGSAYPITWEAPADAVRFKILYSTDNGVTWSLITKSATGSQHPWNVPAFPKNKKACSLNIVGYDASNVKVGADSSDAPFSIEGVSILAPNGPEHGMTSGVPYTISWRSSPSLPVVTVRLQFTLNNGITWKTIPGTPISGNPGSFDWTPPAVSKTKKGCGIKVVLKDAAGTTVGKDTSDAAFSISP